MNHSLGEDATCVRCSLPFPWGDAGCAKAAKVGNRSERTRSRKAPLGEGVSKGYDEAYLREVETRAALCTLPMTLDERLTMILAGVP